MHGFFPSCVSPCFLASNSETHHRFWASMLPFDLIFFIRSFMMAILRCCFISSSSVDSSRACSANAASCILYTRRKFIAQQSSPHFLILYLLFLRTSSISKDHLSLKMHLSYSLRLCTCPGLPPPVSQPTSSSICRSRSGSDLSIFHLFRVFLHSEIWPFLHFFSRPSWYFLLTFGFSHPFTL